MCRKDVAWMFQQWDGNNDGELSMKELVPLEKDSREKCLKAYIDRCGLCLSFLRHLHVVYFTSFINLRSRKAICSCD